MISTRAILEALNAIEWHFLTAVVICAVTSMIAMIASTVVVVRFLAAISRSSAGSPSWRRAGGMS